MRTNRKLEVAFSIFEYLFVHSSVEICTLRDIAEGIDESHAFTRQVMLNLVAEKIVNLHNKGPGANYTLGDRAHIVTLEELFSLYHPHKSTSVLKTKYMTLYQMASKQVEAYLNIKPLDLLLADSLNIPE